MLLTSLLPCPPGRAPQAAAAAAAPHRRPLGAPLMRIARLPPRASLCAQLSSSLQGARLVWRSPKGRLARSGPCEAGTQRPSPSLDAIRVVRLAGGSAHWRGRMGAAVMRCRALGSQTADPPTVGRDAEPRSRAAEARRPPCSRAAPPGLPAGASRPTRARVRDVDVLG